MIQILSRLFQDEFTGILFGGADPGQSELKAVPGDLMAAVYSCELFAQTLCKPMKFDSVLQTITRSDCGVGGSFITDGFDVGYRIVVSGTTTYGYGYGYPDDLAYTITYVTDSVITVASGISVTESASCVNIYWVPDLTNASMDFYYNLIGTNDTPNFQSLTDPRYLQKFTGDIPAALGSNTLATNAGSWAWWDGYAGENSYGGQLAMVPEITIGTTTADYKVPISVVFYFLMKPFYTADQLKLVQDAYSASIYDSAGLAVVNTSSQGFPLPAQFTDGSVVRLIEQFDVRVDKQSSKVSQTSGINDDGIANTAWYNQPFNAPANTTNKIEYYLFPNGVTYLIGGSSVSGIDFTQVTDVTIKVLASSLPVNGDKFVLNFQWLPTNASVYQNYQASVNPATFRDVFIHDRAYNTVGGSGVNGDRYGTAYQVLKNVIAVVNGGDGTIDITFSVDFGSSIKTLFSSLDVSDLNYKLWVVPQKASETTLATSTRNAVLGDVNLATVDLDDSTLVVIDTDGTTDTHFFRYPDVNVNPVTNYSGFSGEFTYSKTDWKIKAGSILQSVNYSFVVSVYDGSLNLVGTSVISSWNNDVSGFWNGKTSEIDIEQSAGFNLAEGDIRNTRSIQRKISLDGGGYYGYESIFGFQLGYQFWQNTVDFVPETASYHTQYWAVYTQDATTTWATLPSGYTSKITFVQQWNVLDPSNGHVTEFNHTSNIAVYDENHVQPVGTYTEVFTTADSNGKNLFGTIASDIETDITATCTSAGGLTIGVPPAGYSTVIAEMTLWYYDGNNEVFDTVTTEADPLDGSLWLGRPVVTVVSPTVVTIVGMIDLSLSPIPVVNERLLVRLGYKV